MSLTISYPFLNSLTPAAASCCLVAAGLRLGKADGTLLQVVDRVPSSQEGVTENGKWAGWLWEIHAHEGGDTASLDLKDVVVWTNSEVLATKLEGDIWERVALLAVNGVLSVVSLLGAHLGVKKLSKSGWKGDEGSSGIENDTSVLELSSGISEGDGVEVNLPIGLAAEWEIGHLALVMVVVDASKDSLRVVALGVSVAEVEGENLLVEESLVDHVVERWHNLVDGDGVVSETKDTIEAAEGESQSWLLSGLGEVLSLDLEIADGELVVGDEPLHAARSVVDLKRRSVRLVGVRLRGVILAVQVASDGAALLRWDPKVRAAGVENDLEALWWVAESDLGEVCMMSTISCHMGGGRDEHCAFKKLLTGTRWSPFWLWVEVSLKTSLA